MRSIAVMNQKGGCGKTTTVTNLAGSLALEGHRTLVIDMDPQAHAGLGLGIDSEKVDGSLYDVLAEEATSSLSITDVIVSVGQNIDLAPSGIALVALEQKLSSEHSRGRTERLARAAEVLKDLYDFVLIDCPPNVGILTFNALRAAQEVIIPLETSYYGTHGMGKFLETIALLEDRVEHRLEVRILVTLFNGRTRLARQALAEIREAYEDRLFDTVIRQNVRLGEAAKLGIPITQLDRRCHGFVDYMSLGLEILLRRQARPVRHPFAGAGFGPLGGYTEQDRQMIGLGSR